MANKITTNVYDAIGNTYTTDVHVVHPINLANLSALETEGKAVMKLVFYKTLADKEAGRMPIQTVDNLIDKNIFDGVLEVNNLTDPTTWQLDVQIAVTNKLKEIYGENNVIEL